MPCAVVVVVVVVVVVAVVVVVVVVVAVAVVVVVVVHPVSLVKFPGGQSSQTIVPFLGLYFPT